jgi:ketosteroid isomerase-like protein
MGTEIEDFLADIKPRLDSAEPALLNGDPGPRSAMWSHNDPVTLFGAAFNASGWSEIGPSFQRLGAGFSNCTAYENEIIAAGASGDLAYIVAFEHVTASIKGAPAQPFVLRVTTVFRREDGEWRAVHRHGDPASENAVALAQRMGSTSAE